jgi:hypothetical protein
VYSISIAILLRLKEFQKLGGSNPFFDFASIWRASPLKSSLEFAIPWKVQMRKRE